MSEPKRKSFEEKLAKVFDQKLSQTSKVPKVSNSPLTQKQWRLLAALSFTVGLVTFFLVWFFTQPKEFNPGPLLLKSTTSTGQGFLSTGVIHEGPLHKPFLSMGNTSGEVFTLDAQGQILFRRKIGSAIIAPLLASDGSILVLGESLGAAVFSNNGDRLYDFRPELKFSGSQAQPILYKRGTEELLIILENSGRIFALEKAYGLKKWELSDPQFLGLKILPSPLLIKDKLFVLSQNGTAMLLEAATGRIQWQRSFSNHYRSSPISLGRTPSKPSILIVSEQGKVSTLNLEDGKTESEFDVGHPMAATPVDLSGELGTSCLLASADGHLLKVNPSQKTIMADLISFASVGTNQLLSYRASPALLTINKTLIAVAIDSHGDLTLLNTKTWKNCIPSFPLKHEVTASPLVKDLDGNGEPEIVILSENGDVLILEWSLGMSNPIVKADWRQFRGEI